MKPAAFTIAAYGVYLLFNGLALLAMLSVALSLLGLPATADPWVRVVGLVAGEIGFYFVVVARNDIRAMFSATVYGRAGAAAIFLALRLSQSGPPQLLLFAAVDLLAASWTYVVCRRER